MALLLDIPRTPQFREDGGNGLWGQPQQPKSRQLLPLLPKRKGTMSQGGILDKRLVSQIREYLEQSVGSLVTVSSTIDYLTSRFPELLIGIWLEL